MNKIVKQLQNMEMVFARVTTAVVAVSAIYISIFWGTDCKVGIDLLWQILITSFVCTLGNIILYTDKENSKWKLLARRAIHFIYINIIVMGAGFIWEWFYTDQWKMIGILEICIIVVFALINVICYFADYKIAEKMNEKLKERDGE